MSKGDRYLIIPGTSGCKLLDNGIDIGWPAELALTSWLSGSILEKAVAVLGVTPKRIVERLSMEFADDTSWFPTKSTLTAGGSIVPGPILTVAYNQFQNYTPFPYDWRSDIRGSGKKLLRFLRDQKPTNGRWLIVAHSQGGLLAIVASKLAAQQEGGHDAFSKLVARVVLLATPIFGTVNAADALINGDNLSSAFSRYFLGIVRTWPALYQMLPSWRGSVRSPTGEPLPGTALDTATWPDGVLDAALLLRARETRKQFFREPLASMEGVDVRIVMSRAHLTRGHIVRDGDQLTLPDPDERGDTLVPEETYGRLMGDFELARSHSIGGLGDTALHFMLANDPVVATEVRQFLGAS